MISTADQHMPLITKTTPRFGNILQRVEYSTMRVWEGGNLRSTKFIQGIGKLTLTEVEKHTAPIPVVEGRKEGFISAN